MRRTLLMLWLALAGPALAEEKPASDLSGSEIRAEVSGNTLTGFNTSGVWFSEYHAPDGRIFGHNNGNPVIDGCWSVKGDEVCYAYARGRVEGTFCWRMSRGGSAGFRIRSTATLVTGIARLEAGNPHDHGDNGQPWDCTGLISRRNGAPTRLALHPAERPAE
jgi:hypothetical protein